MIPQDKRKITIKQGRRFLKDAQGDIIQAAKLANVTVEVMSAVARKIQQVEDRELDRILDQGHD